MSCPTSPTRSIRGWCAACRRPPRRQACGPIYDTDGTLDGERRALDWLQQGAPDGAVGVFYHFRAPDLGDVACRTGPLVLLGRQAAHRGPPIDSVFIDNVEASAAMTHG